MIAKRILSLLVIVSVLSSIGITAGAEETSQSNWSYEKTFTSSDTLESLGSEGFVFTGSNTLADNGITTANGGSFIYGKDGQSMDFDYRFDTYAYKNFNNYSIDFHYIDASNYYTVSVRRNEAIVQLTKTAGGTKYVLSQLDFGTGATANYVGHTYNVSVKNTDAGTVITAKVTQGTNGPVYDFNYTDTLFDTGFDGLDNGQPHESGKIRIRDEWANTRTTYLNIYDISEPKQESNDFIYNHTFNSADTVESLANDGFSFAGTPTVSDDGVQVGTSVTYTPDLAVVTDHYKFETRIYKTTNSYLVRFNVTDSGFYALNLYQTGTFPGDTWSLTLEKRVGSNTYILARDNMSNGSGLTYCTHTYEVEVTNSASGCNIKVFAENEKNGETFVIDYTDTATDIGADKADNGAPFATSGAVTVSKEWSSALIKYFNICFYEVAQSEEPSVQSSVLVLSNDRNPYTGALVTMESGQVFTFDTAYSSIGLDFGEKTKINNIVLTDGNNSNRIHRADLSLYVSDDNANYTRIKDFTATKTGGKVYIYNFTADARYVKVHCHHGVPLQEYMMAESFINYIDDMMSASFSTLPGTGGGEFLMVKELSVTPEKDMNDSVAFVDKSLLSDTGNTPLRFVLDDGYVLSYYTDVKGTYLRIPEAKAGTTVNVSVYGSNQNAAELSDMNSVFEVTYGNKTGYHLNNGNYFRSNISVAQAPNGDVVILANDKADTTLHMSRSSDGGRTWTEPVKVTDRDINCTNGGGGFIVDKNRGMMYFVGYFGSVNSSYSPGVLSSSDNGLTWTKRPYHVQMNGSIGCVYENGIISKSYDGDGPDIDYVFPFNCFETASSGATAGVAFSRDNGRTWQSSPTNVGFWPENWEEAHEAGVSEDTLAYLSNGDMAIIARNQWPNENHYAQSVSHDNGFTWVEDAWRSNIWASNGDPNLMNYKDDIVLLWPGNTNANGTTYTRYPLSIAYTKDDMATWNNKMNVWEGTTYGVYNSEYDRSYATQPGFNRVSYKDSDDMYVFWTHHGAGNGVEGQASIDGILIEDFEDYLYKSKGAAEDFEADEAKYENWFQIKAKTFSNATVSISTDKANTGERALKLKAAGSPLIANRSMPQLMNGEISYDIFVDSISSGNGLYMDLKGVYNSNPLSGTVYSLKFDKDGNVYVLNPDGEYAQNVTSVATLDLTKWNNIKIKFDRATDVAKLYINDAEITDMIIGTELPKIDGVCFIQFYTVAGAEPATVYIDNFMAYEGVKMNAVAK